MKSPSQNRLSPENCNKAKCKTCIFGNTPFILPEERMNEIKAYLSSFSNSHLCHTTNKTCYGSLEFQAKILAEKGIIPEPTVETLLTIANAYLKMASLNPDRKSRRIDNNDQTSGKKKRT